MKLQVPADTLHALAADPVVLGGWAGVVADLTRRLDRDAGSEDPYRTDATRRAPGAAPRRYLEIRDRCCIMIGCRAPAHTADMDHTLDHAKSGLPPRPTSATRAVTIIGSRARAGGRCTSLKRACSAGPAD